MKEELKLQFIFQTLGDANRLRIIKFIGNKDRSVTEIVNNTALSQPLVSHHLKILKKYQILETTRKGPFIYHRVKDERILEAVELFSKIFEKINF